MSYLKFVLVIAFAISCVKADVSEIVQQRPRLSLKSGFRNSNSFNAALTTTNNEDDEDTFPRGFQLPQEHVREPFRPDPHRTPIYHRPTTFLTQQQVVDQEEQIPNHHEGYHYPTPSRPFEPFEPTTARPEFVPSPTEPETEVDTNLLQVQELNNPVFESHPVASHHQSVVYYTLPRLVNPQRASFKQPIKGQHFVPKVFYLPPDYYHQRGEGHPDAFRRF